MKDLRTVYDALKAKYGDKLIVPEDLEKDVKCEPDAPEAEQENRLADIDFETFTVGGVNLKSLIIAAVNAIVKDNEQELFIGDRTIEVTVQDILDYAGLDITELIDEEIENESEWVDAYFDTMKYADNKGDEYELTFLEALVAAALREFGARGWDVTLHNFDHASEGLCNAVDRLANLVNDLEGGEEELNYDPSHTVNLINQLLFGAAIVDISIEEKDEEEKESEQESEELLGDESEEESEEETNDEENAEESEDKSEDPQEEDDMPLLLRVLEDLFSMRSGGNPDINKK